MSTLRDPDAILAAWLEEGPDELPDSTRRAIAAGLRTTAQARRRFGWLAPRDGTTRFPTLGAIAMLAIVAIVAIVAVSAVYRPSATIGNLPSSGQTEPLTPSASAEHVASAVPSPTPPWQGFTSGRFGYRIELPGAWTHVAIADSVDWMPDSLYPTPESAYADRWQSPGTTSPWLLVAVRDPAPEATDAWVSRYVAGLSGSCDAGREAVVSVDNESGVVRSCALVPGGLSTLDVLVVHAGRAYSIQINHRAQDYVPNRELLDQILASIRFAK
jgi:hypothetical protein